MTTKHLTAITAIIAAMAAVQMQPLLPTGIPRLLAGKFETRY